MKKALILSALVLFGGMVFAQRPVQTAPTRNAGNANVQNTINRNNNVARTNATKTYSYTVSEMSIPNVSVMDYATTVKQEGRTDKVKVTISNCSVSISYYLYDANNQAISKNSLSSNGGIIDMSSYQPGEYRLQIIEQKGAEKNFKIIKKQK
ncbi:MAG: hypothetical protein II975_10055 [Bacteroidales bacterium]|nr:hypothetical protein [Bacteroidales bacterium]